jgi:hypothetical protein
MRLREGACMPARCAKPSAVVVPFAIRSAMPNSAARKTSRAGMSPVISIMMLGGGADLSDISTSFASRWQAGLAPGKRRSCLERRKSASLGSQASRGFSRKRMREVVVKFTGFMFEQGVRRFAGTNRANR